jgi:hypothetical protein
VLHFSYIVTVGALAVAFAVLEARRCGRVRPAAVILGITAVCAVPMVMYVMRTLGPTSSDVARNAADVLVRHIPQETMPSRWLGPKAYAQLGLMSAGLVLASGSELLPVLAAPLVIGVGLSAAQITSGNPQLALLFPWRVSVLIVPIATALVVGGCLAAIPRLWADPVVQKRLAAAAVIVIGASCAVGAARMTLNFAYFYDYAPVIALADRVVPERWRRDFRAVLGADALPVMKFVRNTARRGDLYLIPPELERFRLVSGAPALVDLKSHPYKDAEVLEWRRRLDALQAVFASNGDCRAFEMVKDRYPITHVLADERIRPVICPGMHTAYEDEGFTLYRIDAALNAKMEFSP